MELVIVDTFETGCTICGTVAGPFALTDLDGLTVQTPAGPHKVNTRVAFCAPSEQREGCAGQIARVIGYASENEQEHLRELATEALAKCAVVETERDELKRKQLNVVSVDDLMELIGEKGKKGAPGK